VSTWPWRVKVPMRAATSSDKNKQKTTKTDISFRGMHPVIPNDFPSLRITTHLLRRFSSRGQVHGLKRPVHMTFLVVPPLVITRIPETGTVSAVVLHHDEARARFPRVFGKSSVRFPNFRLGRPIRGGIHIPSPSVQPEAE